MVRYPKLTDALALGDDMATSALIDASNLHVGGGVQVAASFLDELAELIKEPEFRLQHPWVNNLHVVASNTVTANCNRETINALALNRRDRRPNSLHEWLPTRARRKFTVSFTIFGPEYGAKKARRQIVGYADVTSVYGPAFPIPKNQIKARLRHLVRSTTSRALTRRADKIIVETSAMKEQTAKALPYSANDIKVVPNTVNGIFSQPNTWHQPRNLGNIDSNYFVFCYISRAYPHKNHNIIGPIIEQLKCQGVTAKCIVTLKDNEWARLSQPTKDHCINIGPIRIEEAPSVYSIADALLFPSLLEAFSVTPLEAAKLDKPMFLSDTDFNRTLFGEHAHYFDPTDSISAGQTIANTIQTPGDLAMHIVSARNISNAIPSPKDRAIRYAEEITEQVRLVST